MRVSGAFFLSLALVGGAWPSETSANQPQSKPHQKTTPSTSSEGEIDSVAETPSSRPGSRASGTVERGTRLRPKRALVGLEIAPGIAIPFKKYLDFGSGENTYTMENGVGYGFTLSLTLDQVELRYSYSSLSAGRVRGRLPDELVKALEQLNAASGKNETVSPDIDMDAEDQLVFHNITFGYRLAFEATEHLHFSIPLGIGLVIARPPDFGIFRYSLYGFGAHGGLRADLMFGGKDGLFALGLDARMSLYVTEPDPNLGGAGYAATKSVFDNAVAWLPMLNIGATLRFYY